MLSYQVYKVMHFFGMFMLFASIGATAIHMANGGTRDSNKSRKLIGASHGVALLLILTGGFGMLARLGIIQGGLPGWIHVKLTLWLLLGLLLALPYKFPGTSKVVWFVAPILGALAAYVALFKPF